MTGRFGPARGAVVLRGGMSRVGAVTAPILLTVSALGLITSHAQGRPAGVIVGTVLAWLLYRLSRVGVVVDGAGVTVRNPVMSTTIPWSRVEGPATDEDGGLSLRVKDADPVPIRVLGSSDPGDLRRPDFRAANERIKAGIEEFGARDGIVREIAALDGVDAAEPRRRFNGYWGALIAAAVVQTGAALLGAYLHHSF